MDHRKHYWRECTFDTSSLPTQASGTSPSRIGVIGGNMRQARKSLPVDAVLRCLSLRPADRQSLLVSRHRKPIQPCRTAPAAPYTASRQRHCPTLYRAVRRGTRRPAPRDNRRLPFSINFLEFLLMSVRRGISRGVRR